MNNTERPQVLGPEELAEAMERQTEAVERYLSSCKEIMAEVARP